MPRYFFNTVDGRRYPDEDGAELPDLEAVHRKATLVVAELLKEQPAKFWEDRRLRVEVTDEAGAEVIAIEVSLTDGEGRNRGDQGRA